MSQAFRAHRPVIMGQNGLVTSAHPLASQAGLEVLRRGGNAVDAAVAVAATLGVVEPYMSGLGGDGIMLIWDPARGARRVLDFVGRTPMGATLEARPREAYETGPSSCIVPGNVGGWLAALEVLGTQAPADVLTPAIGYARDGVPITFRNHEFFSEATGRLARCPAAAAVFLPGGSPPRPGSLLVQKALAASLEALAREGAAAFYGGPLGQAICHDLQQRGGLLTGADLKAFAPVWQIPIGTTFHGHEVVTPPPPSAGLQILETLNLLEGFDLVGMGQNSVDYLHTLIEAVKLAAADRIAYAARPEPPVAPLLSKAYAAERRALIDVQRAALGTAERFNPGLSVDDVRPGSLTDRMRENTTSFSVIDRRGLAVTVTQTLGAPFGAAVVAGETGILLNNLLWWSDVDPESPNALAPHRKVETRMAPVHVFRNGPLGLALGTPGSYGIPQTTTQMLLNMLVFGLDVQSALEAPRVRVYTERRVAAEGRIPADVRAGLEARGHAVEVLPDWSWIVGGGQGFTVDPESGAFLGGADPRRDGYAVAW